MIKKAEAESGRGCCRGIRSIKSIFQAGAYWRQLDIRNDTGLTLEHNGKQKNIKK
ncbi:hypothetical protein [Bacillus glycinifermentans]|uniref:Uncharacterized protein n=1 Tax=Bacillus glycinifermentans TaxID=1664069 RepID=A0ABU6H582_9BACI|nr:hypothetical protein [Bacillus glycinifermentans]MEC0485077.1 hypothetical protein [Bacillus glycinifermentans]